MTTRTAFGESAPIWIAAAVAFGALVISAMFTTDTLPDVGLCAFHRLFDLPCPGCGLTRAFTCISHGDFARAWRLNPFGFLFYALAILVAVSPAAEWVRPGLPRRVLAAPATARLAIVTLAAMWVFGLARIFTLVA